MANENEVGRLNAEVAFTQGAATKVEAARLNVEVAFTIALTRARVTQLAVEVLHSQGAGATARVTQLATEVLHSSPPTTPGGGFVIVIM